MDEKACRQFTVRIHKLLTETPIQVGDAEVMLRISMASVTWNEDVTDLEEFLSTLDNALHTAKTNGKNRIVHHATCH